MWTLFRAWWSLRRVTACSRRQAGSLASNLSRAWVGAPGPGLGRRPRTVHSAAQHEEGCPRAVARSEQGSEPLGQHSGIGSLASSRRKTASFSCESRLDRVVWRPGLPTVKSGGSGRDRCRSAHITPATNALPSLQLDPCSQAHSKACNTCSIPQRLLN